MYISRQRKWKQTECKEVQLRIIEEFKKEKQVQIKFEWYTQWRTRTEDNRRKVKDDEKHYYGICLWRTSRKEGEEWLIWHRLWKLNKKKNEDHKKYV